MENEDLLWSGVNFMGGIAGQQAAPCGAVSAAALVLGLKYRRPLADEKKAEDARKQSRAEAHEFVKRFTQDFGAIGCYDLTGVDFSNRKEAKRFRRSGMSKEKCDAYVRYAIDLLYEFEQKKPVPA